MGESVISRGAPENPRSALKKTIWKGNNDMSSTNKTAHIQLNQWVGTDPVLMADFNADNEKIDEAVKSVQAQIAVLPKIETGSYTGNGQYGSSHPNTLSFSFTPKFVAVFGASYVCFFAGNSTVGAGWCINRGTTNLKQHTVWNDNGVSWYIENAYGTDSNWTTNAGHQMNANGAVYSYFAIG